MLGKIVETSPFVLPAHVPIRRTPARPKEMQQERFDWQYDNQTVWVDAIESRDDGGVWLVGPPLLNLRETVGEAELLVDGVPVTSQLEFVDLDRAHRAFLPLTNAAEEIEIRYGGEYSHAMRISRSLGDCLSGSHVLVAMQRNNPLSWIREWASVYCAVNEVDAVVIYDMNSTFYRESDIVNALSDIRGLETVIIVKWPYKYGVQAPAGFGGRGWDSDYGQYVAWEHCRRRFLGDAYAVTIADTDELFLAEDGGSIFRYAEENPSGVVRFMEHLVEPFVDENPSGERSVSYSNYCYVDGAKALRHPKWAAVLGRLSDANQLNIHSVTNIEQAVQDDVRGREFLAMKLAWKTHSFERAFADRLVSRVRPEQRETLFVDEVLQNAVSRGREARGE